MIRQQTSFVARDSGGVDNERWRHCFVDEDELVHNFLEVALLARDGTDEGIVIFEQVVCLGRASRLEEELVCEVAELTRFAHDRWWQEISSRVTRFLPTTMSVIRRLKIPHSARRRYSTATSTENPAEYCQNLVRKHDYESYLAGPFYPPHLKNGFYALKAFSVSQFRFVVISAGTYKYTYRSS